MLDIYFAEEYGKLYEGAENGKAILYKYEDKEGSVRNLFVLRKIPIDIDGEAWYDIVTPYGYGGPLIENIADGFTEEELEAAFAKDFSDFCSRNRIVSEFVRFHPLFENARKFENTYQITNIRHTLGTNLAFENPVGEEFSKGCRKNIRRALSKGITWRVTERPADISVFKKIYYSTMDRNGAGEYYYFDDKYFDDCQKYFKDNLLFVEALYEEKTIAAGLYFIWGDLIHIHLSGTLSEYLYLSPAYILRYAVTLWGKENGYKLIHHGGGRSNAADDSLFLFKKQFASKTEFNFSVGKKIWNNDVYSALCNAAGVSPESDFFPAYRQHH